MNDSDLDDDILNEFADNDEWGDVELLNVRLSFCYTLFKFDRIALLFTFNFRFPKKVITKKC